MAHWQSELSKEQRASGISGRARRRAGCQRGRPGGGMASDRAIASPLWPPASFGSVGQHRVAMGKAPAERTGRRNCQRSRDRHHSGNPRANPRTSALVAIGRYRVIAPAATRPLWAAVRFGNFRPGLTCIASHHGSRAGLVVAGDTSSTTTDLSPL